MRLLNTIILLVMLAMVSITSVAASRPHAIVPPGAPQALIIPRIGVHAAVEAINMTRPSDVHAPYKWGDVAWYSNWAKPGEPGRAQIYGHLDSDCCPAVFWNLKLLAPGDRVMVQYGDGNTLTFVVQWNRVYPNTGMPLKFMFAPTQDRGLILLTCAGVFHRDGSGYDHKDVVYAKLLLPPGTQLPPPVLRPSQRLATPNGVAVAANGDVIVADTGHNRIQEFSADGRLIGDWGHRGSAPGQFRTPTGVAVDQAGNIYVADSGNNRIQKLSPQGKFLVAWGSWGSEKGQFENPNGVALDSAGNIYVADSGNNRIQKLSPAGDVLAVWPRATAAGGTFDSPDSLTVNAHGAIYVADSGNARIDALSSDGVPIKAWRVAATRRHSLAPEGVAVDSKGHVYVVGPGANFVLIYSASGHLLRKWGKAGKGPGRFLGPSGIAPGLAGDIYVADTGNNRVEELTAQGRTVHVLR